jgi:hypothetical protein
MSNIGLTEAECREIAEESKMDHKINLPNDAERERLDMLAEEAAEVIKCISKIKRHGYGNYNPDDRNAGTNRMMLERELMDFWSIYERMAYWGEVSPLHFNKAGDIWQRKLKYTYFQPDRVPVNHPPLGYTEATVGKSNAYREGWKDFYAGVPRDACPFPLSRADLHNDWGLGWDKAKQNSEGLEPYG